MDIPPGLIGQLTPAGLLLLLVLLLFVGYQRGTIVAGKQVDRLTTQWDAEKKALTEQWAVEKRDLIKQFNDRLVEVAEGGRNWREAHHTSEEIRANVAAQMETLRINSEVAVRVLTALPGAFNISGAIESADHYTDLPRRD